MSLLNPVGVTDRIENLIWAEASFRSHVVTVLHDEAERLRCHRVVVDQEGGSRDSLDEIVRGLENVAEKLAEQAGLFACALGRCHHPWHGTGTASSAPHQVQLESRAS